MADASTVLQLLLSYHYDQFSLRDILKLGKLNRSFKESSLKALQRLVDRVSISNVDGKTSISLVNKKAENLLEIELEEFAPFLEGLAPRHLSLKDFHCSAAVASFLKDFNTKKLETLEMDDCNCPKSCVNVDFPKLQSVSGISASLLLELNGFQLKNASMDIKTISKAKEILRCRNPELFYHETEELFHDSLTFSCENLELLGSNVDFIKQEDLQNLVRKLRVNNLSLKPKEWSGFFERDLGFAIKTGGNIEEEANWQEEERIQLESFNLTVKSCPTNSLLPSRLFSWFSVQDRISVFYETKRDPKEAVEEIVNTCYKLPKETGKIELNYALEEINPEDFWDIYGDRPFTIFSRRLMSQLETLLFKIKDYKISAVNQRLQVTAVREEMTAIINVEI